VERSWHGWNGWRQAPPTTTTCGFTPHRRGQLAAGWSVGGNRIAGTEWQEDPDGLVGDGQGGVFLAWNVGGVDARVQHLGAYGALVAGSWREGGITPVPSGSGVGRL